MLDQNTDRMWFVIGAVIVGAAIIFIANGSLPTLFASVADSFEEATNEGTTIVTEIIGPRENHVLDSYAVRSVHTPTYIDYYLDEGIYPEMVGNTFTVSFDARALVDGEHVIDTYFSINPMGGTSLMHGVMSNKMNLTDEWQRFSVQIRADELPYEDGHAYSLRFRGNIPANSNNKNGFQTQRVKVEIGHNETDYIPHEDEEVGGN